MIRSCLFAAALLLAAPAAAQSAADNYDDGDWYLIQPPSDNLVILSNGKGKRHGDVVELDIFAYFRKPQRRDVVTLRLVSPVDCKAKTGDMWTVTTFYSDRAPTQENGTGIGMKAFVGPAPSYAFACTTDHSKVRHFTNRSRKAVLEEILGDKPRAEHPGGT